MKTNQLMNILLKDLSPSSDKIDSNLFNPIFNEWDNCILIDSASLNNISSYKETIYSDRTDLESSINHVNINDLWTGVELIRNWEEQLRSQYPDRQFILILSSTPEGEDVVIRFYQIRKEEVEWIDLNNLELYTEEALIVIEILNVIQ